MFEVRNKKTNRKNYSAKFQKIQRQTATTESVLPYTNKDLIRMCFIVNFAKCFGETSKEHEPGQTLGHLKI